MTETCAAVAARAKVAAGRIAGLVAASVTAARVAAARVSRQGASPSRHGERDGRGDAPAAQAVAEPRPGAGEPAGDGAGGAAQQRRDLVAGQAFEVAEDDGHAEAFGEAVHLLPDDGSGLGSLRCVAGRGPVARGRGGLAAAAASLGHPSLAGDSLGDPTEPAAE